MSAKELIFLFIKPIDNIVNLVLHLELVKNSVSTRTFY